MATQVDTPQSRCLVGVARRDITPPVGIYHRMWGAASHDRATGVHRPLLATGLWLKPWSGEDDGQLVIAVDHCVMDSATMARLRAAVADAAGAAGAAGVTLDRVHVCLSHTHGSCWLSPDRASFPGGELIGPYLDDLARWLAELARDALAALKPATISYGLGRCDLAAHRDFWDAERGHYVCGFNSTGPADDTVVVARITGNSGDCLATIVNYACHPTTLAWDNTALSPDYVGAMRDLVERATGGPCLFLQGASGDLGPREGFVGDWQVADRNGRRLGYAALAALEAIPAPATRFVYTGPVVSGTRLGAWNHVALDAETLRSHEAWRTRAPVVDLPYRHDLPTLDEARSAHAKWRAEEEEARAAGDLDRARDRRALVEQMHRQIARLTTLPAGKTFPFRIQVWRLGDALWILTPGELYQTFQTTLRSRIPNRPIVIATLTDDWQPGYLPAASSYGYGIYQDVIAALGPGSLETLIEAAAREIGACS